MATASRVLGLAALIAALVATTGCATSDVERADTRRTADPRPSASASATATDDPAPLTSTRCDDLVSDARVRQALDTSSPATFPDATQRTAFPEAAVGGLDCEWSFSDAGYKNTVAWRISVVPAATASSDAVAEAVSSAPDCTSSEFEGCVYSGLVGSWWYRSGVSGAQQQTLIASTREAIESALGSVAPAPPVTRRAAIDCRAADSALMAAQKAGSSAPIAYVEEGDLALAPLPQLLQAAESASGTVTCAWVGAFEWRVTFVPRSTAGFEQCAASPRAVPVDIHGVTKAVTVTEQGAAPELCATDGTSSIDAGVPTIPNAPAMSWDTAHLAYAAKVVPEALTLASR